MIKMNKNQVIELPENEINKIKRNYKPKIILNIILLIIGIFMSVYSLIEFILGSYFIIPIVSSMLGLYLIARFKTKVSKLRNSSFFIPRISKYKEYFLSEEEKNKNSIQFRSFCSSRLIITIPNLILAIFTGIFFGIELEESYYGNWLILNGFSLFYPISLFPLIISFGLIIFVFISTKVVNINKTKNFFIITEYRLIGIFQTEISRDEIKVINLENENIGPKYIWCLLILPYVIYIFKLGFPLILNPFAFGYAFLAGGLYILSGSIMLVSLLILLLKNQYILEIITEDKRYEMQISLPAFSDTIRNSIEHLFELDSYKNSTTNFNLKKSELKIDSFYFRLITGLILFGLGLISDTLRFYAGDLFSYFLYIYSFILIIKAVKEDIIYLKLSQSLHIINNTNEKSNNLILKRQYLWYYKISSIRDCNSNHLDNISIIKKNYIEKSLKFNSIDLLFMLSISFFAGLTISGNLRYTPINLFTLGIIICYFLISLMIICMFIFITAKPSIHFKFKFNNFNYEIDLQGRILFIQANQQDRTRKLNITKIDEFKHYLNINKRILLVILLPFLIGLVFAFIF